MIFDRPQRNAGAAPPDRAAKQRRAHRPPLEREAPKFSSALRAVAVECRYTYVATQLIGLCGVEKMLPVASKGPAGVCIHPSVFRDDICRDINPDSSASFPPPAGELSTERTCPSHTHVDMPVSLIVNSLARPARAMAAHSPHR